MTRSSMYSRIAAGPCGIAQTKASGARAHFPLHPSIQMKLHEARPTEPTKIRKVTSGFRRAKAHIEPTGIISRHWPSASAHVVFIPAGMESYGWGPMEEA